MSSVATALDNQESSRSFLRKRSSPANKKEKPLHHHSQRQQQEHSLNTDKTELYSPIPCKSDPQFIDNYGDSCAWYERNDDYCGAFADTYKNSRGITANRACCICDGGYEFYPFNDSSDNNIDNISESVVFQECDLDPSCDGFNATTGFYVKRV